MMHRVATGQLPPGLVDPELARVERAASWLEWDRGELWAIAGLRRLVPPIGIREQLVYDVAQSLGFPGGARVSELVKARYYWANMKP